MLQDRRTFLRKTAGIGGASILHSLAGCARGGDAIGDIADDNGEVDPTPDTSDFRVQSGMDIGLGSTAFVGLAGPSQIDPDEPGGGRLVTVDSVEFGERVTVSWRRTVERELTPGETDTAGAAESSPTPETEIVEESGTVTATGLDDAHAALLPMYWRPGETTTETSAIWLSQEAANELSENGQTAWSPDVLTRISRLNEEAVEEIEEGVSEVDEVYLNAEDDSVEFDLIVNGQSTTVQAIHAYDTFGNAYRILDSERNPLILKFTYDAVSTGFAGIDAGLWSLIKTVFSGYQVAEIDTS